MAELVPDAWQYTQEETKCCHSTRRHPRRGPVTNILLWLDCFSTLATVLMTRYNDKASELWAYQRTIITAQRDFDGEAWVTYDSCYRRQAAAKKSLDWSRLDFGLYNQAFAGKAKTKIRCKTCLSEFHTSADCPLAPEPRRQLDQDRPSSRFQRTTAPSSRHGANAVEFCQLFNNERGNNCRYHKCRYLHVCSNRGCHGQHPRSECKLDTRKRPRSPIRPPYPT